MRYASARPWTYHSRPSPTTACMRQDWIEDANGNMILQNVGHLDGPLLCAAVNHLSLLAVAVAQAKPTD